MQTTTTIGLDIAKSIFNVHGIDAAGNVVVRRQLKRRYVPGFFQRLQPCLIGIDASASSHHWSRELRALGHTMRLGQGQLPVLWLDGRASPIPRASAPRLKPPRSPRGGSWLGRRAASKAAHLDAILLSICFH
jgi:hypothetical protein